MSPSQILLYIKKWFLWDICSLVIQANYKCQHTVTLCCLKLFSVINWITRMSTMYMIVYYLSQI